VREVHGKIKPVKEREIIRAAGPTVASPYRQARRANFMLEKFNA